MLEIRPAAHADVDALVRLEAALFREDSGVHEPYADVTWPEREGVADLVGLIDGDRSVVLAGVDGDVHVGLLVGYLAAFGPTRRPADFAELRTLYVAPSHRRTGLARALTDAFVEWARAGGAVEVHVSCYAANEPARRLYESIGFAPRSIQHVRPL